MLPPIPAIQAKHWRAMTEQDQYVAEVFPEPPLVAFRNQSNMIDLRTKVPPIRNRHSERKIKGKQKCDNTCKACP